MVRSEPDGADVFLGDNFVGSTPATLELPTGCLTNTRITVALTREQTKRRESHDVYFGALRAFRLTIPERASIFNGFASVKFPFEVLQVSQGGRKGSSLLPRSLLRWRRICRGLSALLPRADQPRL